MREPPTDIKLGSYFQPLSDQNKKWRPETTKKHDETEKPYE
jgi:hypothetical protein